MPIKKYANSRRKKIARRYKRYSQSKKIVTPVRYDSNPSFPLNAFPNSYTAKLRYVEETSLNAAAGTIASYVYRANDCYDPNLTGVGHQPKGFDELMARYDHFTVIGSRITIKYMPTTPQAGNTSYLGIYLSDSGTRVAGHSSVSDLLESRSAGRYITVGDSAFSGRKNAVYNTFSAKKFFRKKEVVGDSLYRGTIAASPTEQAYYELYAASCGGIDSSAVNILVVIDYLVVFTERKYLSPS